MDPLDDEFPLFNDVMLIGIYIPLLFVLFYGVLMHILYKLIKHSYWRIFLFSLLIIMVFIYSISIMEQNLTIRIVVSVIGAFIGFAYFFITTYFIDPKKRVR